MHTCIKWSGHNNKPDLMVLQRLITLCFEMLTKEYNLLTEEYYMLTSDEYSLYFCLYRLTLLFQYSHFMTQTLSL